MSCRCRRSNVSGVTIVAALAQGRTAQPVGSRSNSPPVVIGEPEAPPAQLPPQDPILLDQVRQHFALPLVQPAGNREQQHLEGRDLDHVRELTSPPISHSQPGRPRRGTLRPEPCDVLGERHLRRLLSAYLLYY